MTWKLTSTVFHSESVMYTTKCLVNETFLIFECNIELMQAHLPFVHLLYGNMASQLDLDILWLLPCAYAGQRGATVQFRYP